MRRTILVTVVLFLVLTTTVGGCRFSCNDEALPPVKAVESADPAPAAPPP